MPGSTRAAIVAVAAAGVVAGGCLVAAAGAGAGGAIYLSDRGVESVVTASVDRAFEAARRAFGELQIAEGRTATEREGESERRQLEGSTADRDVTVTVRARGDGSHVEVVVRRSAVTWDKDFARRLLERIVKLSQ